MATTGLISSSGVGSGLDVESIVKALMGVEKQPLNQIQKQITTTNAKISAFGTISSGLSTFQSTVSKLATASKFNAQSATSSDTTVLTGSTSGTATPGDYSITVSQLAQAQKLSSGTFSSVDSTIGTGTMTISLGTYNSTGNTFSANTAKTDLNITIDSTNNTLGGLKDAINAANSNVTATIINDGTGYRLVLNSKDSGANNGMKITVADASDASNTDTNGLSAFAYDPTATAGSGKNLTLMKEAQDAKLTIDGISVTKSSNTITDAISGVTLNLAKVSATATTLSVATDKTAITKSVNDFVSGFNTLMTSLRNLTKYDEAGSGKSNGALLGDSTANSIITQLKQTITKSVGLTGSITSLSDIGVAFQKDGTLALDSTKLSSALDSNFAGVAKLFVSSATSTDPLVSFVGSTSKTAPGTYAVNVTQLASGGNTAAGTINGVAATSTGNNLVGATGDASEGLNLTIGGTTTGARGSVTYTVGYAASLNNLLTNLLSDTGTVKNKTDGLSKTVKSLNTQVDSWNNRLSNIEDRYRAQYKKLDTMMSQLKSTSSYLTTQLAALANTGSGSN